MYDWLFVYSLTIKWHSRGCRFYRFLLFLEGADLVAFVFIRIFYKEGVLYKYETNKDALKTKRGGSRCQN